MESNDGRDQPPGTVANQEIAAHEITSNDVSDKDEDAIEDDAEAPIPPVITPKKCQCIGCKKTIHTGKRHVKCGRMSTNRAPDLEGKT